MSRQLALAMIASLGLAAAGTSAAQAANVVNLTQVGCQFVESENGINRGYTPAAKADCDAINARTAEKRLAESKPIELAAGKYTFHVTNKTVPYELGFWLRSKDYDWRNPLHKLTKVSVSGGGLTLGKSNDYEVDLKPGEYVYSCPLNTTPDYRLIVK